MCKVLVVENNPTILKLLSHHLESEGCQVTTAVNGLEALLEIDKEIPDLIFTDIIMPKVSGDQLCTIIRRDNRLKDIFLAIHSSTSLEDNRLILDLDADVYIAKGPQANLKDHIFHTLDQYKKGIRRNQTTIGGETLHPREITKELLLSRKHYHAIFNSVAEAVVEMDISGKIVQANMATQKLLRRNLRQILSVSFIDFLDPQGREEVLAWLGKIAVSQPPCHDTFNSSYEKPLLINKRRILLKMVAISETDDSFIIGILQDITQQKNTEERLAQTLSEFNAVVETIDHGIVLMNDELKICLVNQAFRELWGLPATFTDTMPSLRELMEHSSREGVYPIQPEKTDDYINTRMEQIRKGGIPPTEIELSNGKILQFQCVVLPDNGRLLTYYDITSLKNTEKELARALEKVSNLANHDPLTGLANLRLARERLFAALSLSKRKDWKTAVMFLDLDGFKNINDTYGHDFGDEVLKKIAERLLASLRQSDTVARIGGDEFLVILTEVSHRLTAANVAEKIIEGVSEPIEIDGRVITIGISIGIAIYPDNGEDSRMLMKKADDAMYYTKRIGKNSYTFTPD